MQDVEGNTLQPGDVVLFIEGTIDRPHSRHLEPGIISHIDSDIAYILDMTLTYQRRKTSQEIILRTSDYRGVNPSLIAELYNTERTTP